MSNSVTSSVSDKDISLRVVDSYEGFVDLKESWNSLYEKSPHSTIFSSWDWVITWWEVFQDQYKRELMILCFYDNEELIGIAPFQIDKNNLRSFVQGKTLRFIGAGEARQDSVTSECMDFIVLPQYEDEIVSLVSNYLVENKARWNFADFEYLLKDALILKCFTSSESKISRQKIQYGVRFFIPEHETFDEYLSSMSSRWRKMYAKKTRILARDGDVITDSTSPDKDIEPIYQQLREMHCARWQDKTERCIFESSRFDQFHKTILERLVPQNKAFIKILKLNDEPLASYYSFNDKGRIHYYQSGFFSEKANRYSPLFLLICNEIELAIDEKNQFDFMFADDAQSYKQGQYAADLEKMYRLKWTTQPFRFFMFSGAKIVQTNVLQIIKLAKNKLKK